MTAEKISPAQKAQLWGSEAFIFEQEVPSLPASVEAQPSCSGLLSFHGLSEKGSAFLHSSQIKGNTIGLQSIPCFFLSPSTSVSLTFSPGARDWDPRCWAALHPPGQAWLRRSSALGIRKSCLNFLVPGKVV